MSPLLRGLASALLAALGVATAGCEDPAELAQLQARLDRLESDRSEQQAIAHKLNEHRRELHALEQRIAAANISPTWDAADALLRLNRATSGAVETFTPNEQGATASIGGQGGPEAMQRAIAGLMHEVPLARVSSAELRRRRWRIELVLEDLVVVRGAALDATPSAPPPLPPITRKSRGRSHQLRARIAQAERHLSELSRVLGAAGRIRQVQRRSEALLLALDEPERVKRALPIIEAVFASRPALVSDGSARFADGALRLQIIAGKKPDELGAALSDRARVVAFSDGPPASVELALLPPVPR